MGVDKVLLVVGPQQRVIPVVVKEVTIHQVSSPYTLIKQKQ